ncbi:hypothetical protein Tco_1158100 [Tanacetum coccineum]
MSRRPAYTTLSNPQGVIYEDKLKRKRFMRADELHKFSDGTLISVRDTLDQMLHELHLGYNTAMRRRLWTKLDQQRTRIMIKAINQKLLDRRIMRSLEKIVGGIDYGEYHTVCLDIIDVNMELILLADERELQYREREGVVSQFEDIALSKISQDDDSRLCLADDLKEAQVHMQVKLKRTSSSLKSKDHYTYHKLKDKDSIPRAKTKDIRRM